MHVKLVALLLLITHLAIADSVVNVHGRKPTRTSEETKSGLGPGIRYGNKSQVRPLDVRAVRYRLAGGVLENSLKRVRKGTAPVAGEKAGSDPSFLDYFDVAGDDEEQGDGDEEDEEDDDDDDDDDEYDENDVKKNKKRGAQVLRGGRRKYVRAHKIIFPLLLAYKLKFFTMLPLLVGSLVLLVGTTGIAGFFFALFSAALGLQVKSRH